MTPRLNIELDRPDGRYRPWEMLSGRVIIESDKVAACDRFVIALRASTSGEGTYETKDYAGNVFKLTFGVELGRSEYPFEFQIPGTPVTYRGENFAIDIAAVAMLAPTGYGLIEASVPLEIDADDLPRTFEQSARVKTAQPSGWGVWLSYTIVAAGVVVGMIIALLAGPETGTLVPMTVAVIVSLAVAIPLYFRSTRNVLASKKLGSIDYEVVPIHDGGRFFADVRMAIEPVRAVSLNSIVFEIEGRESSTPEFDDGNGSLDHELLLRSVEFGKDAELAPGEIHRFEGRIELPADTPTTVDLRWNRVSWTTSLRIDVAGGVDHVEQGRLEMKTARPQPGDHVVLDVGQEAGAESTENAENAENAEVARVVDDTW